VIAVDTNILVYAHRKEAPHFRVAAALLKDLSEKADPWAIPWPCVSEFFSVVTNAKLWKGAESTPEEALKQLNAWRSAPSCALLSETPESFDTFSSVVMASRVRGAAVHDARISALCKTHGIKTLISADRDFSRFSHLKVKNPF
jgi:uncharacterized protein